MISKIFSLRAYLCVFPFFVCFPSLLNFSMPHLAILCVCVSGVRGCYRREGLPQTAIFLSTLYFLHMHARTTLPPPPIMELNLGGGKNAVAYQDSEVVCSDLESVLSSLMHCP